MPHIAIHPLDLLCSFRLVDEVAELEESVRKLELKTDDAEDRLRNLQHTRLSLEKEQWAEIRQNNIGTAVKKGSLFLFLRHSILVKKANFRDLM